LSLPLVVAEVAAGLKALVPLVVAEVAAKTDLIAAMAH
jgi:hypothetical protein